jgi:hypothetical protein
MDHVFVYARDPHTGTILNTPKSNPHEIYRASLKADLRDGAVRQDPDNACILETTISGDPIPCKNCRRCC